MANVLSTITVYPKDILVFNTFKRKKQSELNEDLTTAKAFELLLEEYNELKKSQTVTA